MKTRALGRTGLRVTELALGTWGLSGDGYGPVEERDAAGVINRAAELGIRLFETCDAYGAGRMERLLGEQLADVDGALIFTRGGLDRTTEPPRKRFDAAYLRDAVERSQKRLRRKQLDAFLLHNPSVETLRSESTAETMRTLVADGLIGRWGASVTTLEAARAALDARADVLEIPHNVLYSTALNGISGELLVAGTGVLVRSVLNYGMLSGFWSRDHSFSEGDHRRERWTAPELAGRIADLDGIRFLVRGDVHTMRGAAVRFALSNTVVSSAVLGPRTITQLDQLVRETGSGPLYLPDADLVELARRT